MCTDPKLAYCREVIAAPLASVNLSWGGRIKAAFAQRIASARTVSTGLLARASASSEPGAIGASPQCWAILKYINPLIKFACAIQ